LRGGVLPVAVGVAARDRAGLAGGGEVDGLGGVAFLGDGGGHVVEWVESG
jgi:hypothetical protein